METVTDFILGGSKVTTDGDCSYEIKRHLLLGRKAMTNLDSLLKSRDITLPTKVSLVKAMVFPVVMYTCESGTIKKAECWRTDAFELWCWRRLLRVPWTARRSYQSILKEISPEYSLEGLKLKPKLQYFGTWCKELTHWKRPWCWERLKAGDGNDRGRDGWMASPTWWTWVWVSSRSWWWTGRPGQAVHGVAKSRTRLSDWTELMWLSHALLFVSLLTVAHQAPLSMGFSRQEYCSKLPCPPLGDLPDPGIKLQSLMSPALEGGFFLTNATWDCYLVDVHCIFIAAVECWMDGWLDGCMGGDVWLWTRFIH